MSPKTKNMDENGMEMYALKSIENRPSPDRDINNIDLVSTQGKYLNSYIFDRVFDCCDNILTENMDIDLDVKNFDLTTYITEDDCNLPSTNGKKIVLKTKPIRISSGKPSNYKKITNNLNRHQYPYNKNMKFDTDTDTDSESEDSDESVDVETICDNTTRSPEKFIIKTEKIDDCILDDPPCEFISEKILSSSAESNRSVVVSFSLFFFLQIN